MKASYLAMTGYDGVAPGFEVWPAASRFCDPRIAAASVERTLSLCELAEELRFDAVSVSEHHYAPYMMTPNPAVMAAAIIQRVKRARIALLGPLVPLANPVKLAEEVAMLDVMSGGRISVLFLRGTPNEHKTYDTPPESTHAVTQEGIDLIIKALTENEPFSWKGAHFKFNTISVWPKVIQKPHPLFFGSGGSAESVRFAAQRGLGIAFSFAPPETIGKWIDLYREECATAGWNPTPAHVIYRGIAHLADTDATAEAEMGEHFGRKQTEQAQLQSKTMGGPPLNSLIIGRPLFAGSTATVTKACSALHECGVGHIDMVFSIGTHEQQVRSLKQFAKDVLPFIQDWSDQQFARPSRMLSETA
jgi:alkanesulfonate monooxygenase SsuD/methylene tetrahydromethanopterin reductase-like flavin-dependent oxidoreductase (luciferase family)